MKGPTDGHEGDGDHAGLLRRAVRRLTTPPEELQADELRRESVSRGATAVANCGDRQRVTVVGTVRALTLRPRGGTPALEVELYDGTAPVTVIWLGRRELAGVSPGRQLRVTGTIATADGRRVIFNPRYELIVTDTGD